MRQLLPIFVFLIATAACTPPKRANTRAEQTAATNSFDLTIPESATANTAFTVSWTTIEAAVTYTLIAAYDAACQNTAIKLLGLETTSQDLVLSIAGAYYICVTYVDSDGNEFAATNSGALLEVGNQSGGSGGSDSESSSSDELVATSLSFNVQPVDALKATALTSFSVEVLDQNGARLTTASGSIALGFTENPGSASLGGTSTVAISSGVATFTNVSVSEWSLGYKLSATLGALTATSASFHVYEPFVAGDGSGGSPYEIDTLARLQTVNYYKSSNFVMKSHIDASATSTWDSNAGFLPIGNCGDDNDCSTTADNACFAGTIDGDRATNGGTFEIRDLTVSRATLNGVGLFGCVDVDSATAVYRMVMKRATVTGNNHVGALVGYNSGGAVINFGAATGSVTGAESVGGLVGTHTGSGAAASIVQNSYADVAVSASGQYAGGLIGLSEADVTGSVAKGAVSGTTRVGGLIGRATAEDVLVSYATGSVSGTIYLGGLIGMNNGTAVLKSFATGTVKGTSFVGGLIGANNDAAATIDASFASGHVIASSDTAGGLIGANQGTSTVIRSFASGKVNSATSSGGLIGTNASGASVTLSFWHDHRRNPNACIGSDSSTSTDCVSKYDGVNPNLDLVAFAPEFLDGRKIGSSDKSAFRIWGTCDSEGETVHVIVVQGGSSLTPTTQPTCSMGAFSTTVDVSTLTDDDTINDTTNDIKVTLEADWGGCTQGTDCYIVARALLKDSTTCDGYTTLGSGFAGGDGLGSGTAYTICDEAQFENIRNSYNTAKYYELGDNISFSDTFEGPIGTNTSDDFDGFLEGDGFRIRNAFVHDPGTSGVGLIGYQNDSSAYIQNVTIEDATVVAYRWAGLLIGYTGDGTLTNNNVSGDVIASYGQAGGLTGILNSGPSIATAKSYANIAYSGTSSGVVGVVVGQYVSGGSDSIANAESYGHITANYDYAGGIVGQISGAGDLNNSYSYSHVLARGYSGSAMGSSTGTISAVSNSGAFGNVLADFSNIGGFGGHVNSTFSACFSRGNVMSSANVVGGFVGLTATSSTIDDSWASGSAWGGSTVAGFVASMGATSSVATSFATGNVYGSNYTGGFVGVLGASGSLTHAYGTGDAWCYSTSACYTGGFAGAFNGSASFVYATGNLYSTGNSNGGLVGTIASGQTLEQAWASGHVEGNTSTGGLAGQSIGDITNAFASGLVTSASVSSGGLIGSHNTGATTTRVFWHKFSGNKTSCVGTESGTSDCYESFNPAQQSIADVTFAPYYKDGRKAGASDVGSFVLRGSCNEWDATISISATDGSNNASASSDCRIGHWVTTIDLSSMNEGNVTVTAEEQNGSCTPSSTCATATLTVDKETTQCDGVYVSDTASFTSGTGADDANAYLICTREQLENIATLNTTGVYFKLGNNIDLSGSLWNTIGSGSPSDCNAGNQFCGVFNGDGFRIDNMVVNLPSTDRVALLGYQNGTSTIVQNLGMEHAYVVGQNQVGIITGQTYNGDNNDLYTVGHVLATTDTAGGVSGRHTGSNASLIRATSYTNVMADNSLGGIHGTPQGSSLSDSANHGHLMSTTTGGLGGLLGNCNSSSSVDTSYNTGNIIGDGYRNGGISGSISNCQFSDVYSTGNIVSDSRNVGGLSGEATAATAVIIRGYSTTNIAATSDSIGGLVGLNDGDIDDSFSTGIVIGGSTDIGGAIGDTTVSTVDNVHYYDHAGNPNATCAGTGSPTSCTANSTLTDFHDQSPGGQNAPISSFDFSTTPIWNWDSGVSDFPILNWQ